MIRDTTKTEEQTAAAGQMEEGDNAQPDLVARVLVFLLKEIRQNNPDSARECDHLKKLIIEDFGPVDVVNAPPPIAQPAEPAAAAAPATTPKPSRRFRR